MHNRTIAILTLGLILAATLPLAAADTCWGPYTPLDVQGQTLKTLKHTFTLDASGLPAQIVIHADPRDLPLEKRSSRAQVEDAELIALGRGPTLREPLRLLAVVNGQVQAAKVTSPAKPAGKSDSQAVYRSTLQAGPIQMELETTYECDGAILCKLTYSGGKVDSLELVLDVLGPVDLAYAGLPAGYKPGAIEYAKLSTALAPDEGVVWDSLTGPPAAKGPFLGYLYFGSGDRGFTFLCDGATGWTLDAKAPAMTIERDKAGQATWRAKFINAPGAPAGKKTVEFGLLTHPSRPRPAHYLKQQWLAWTSGTDGRVPADGLGATTLANRAKLKAAARTAKEPLALPGMLTAGALESVAATGEMTGGAGADIVSVEKDGAVLYPASLFRVLAAPYTGLAVRIRTNIGQVVTPGDLASPARITLGRALAHGIGADLAGLAQPVDFLRVVKALEAFGAFDDEDTEVIPYWRSAGVARYGEPFDASSGFELSEGDPYAQVYITIYRRPIRDPGNQRVRGYKALFVILNESGQAVRERLFIVDPKRVLGNANNFATGPMSDPAFGALDMSRILAMAPQVDWREEISLADWRMKGATYLLDLEDHGRVKSAANKGRSEEIYGPLFVHPHDFRILYGHSYR